MSNSEPVFIGWPNEGVEFWNAYWRWQAAQGFFDDIWEESRAEMDDHDRERAQQTHWASLGLL